MTRSRAAVPTADDLGLMRGSPPPPGRLVTRENWLSPPFNRWSLQHVGELVPVAPVPRGDEVWELGAGDADLTGVTFELDGDRWSVDEALLALAADGIVVLHDGRVAWERYLNGMGPSTRHICYSVSKSIVASLAGVLVARGALDPSMDVTDVLPELSGTSWVGASVQHLLDMRTGTAYAEVYDDLEGDVGSYRQVTGWFPRTNWELPADVYGFLATLGADRPHGGRFDYRTPLTSLLGWVCERAGGDRLPALLSRELWQPLGAEHDAAIGVDPHGNAIAGSGFCAALRDLARFGELWRLGGVRPDGRRVVPGTWVADTLAGATDGREAFTAQTDGPDPDWPDAFYRNKWWILDPGRPLFSAIGIHGQFVTVDGPSRVVVAMVSSQPVADDEDDFRLAMAAFGAIRRELSPEATVADRPVDRSSGSG